MSGKKHQKASDVFRESDSDLVRKWSFEEEFPQVKDLRVEVEWTSAVSPKSEKWVEIDKVGEFINCRNPCCYNGGFRIAAILREMVRSKLTTLNREHIFCQGYEGSPKGRRRTGSCVYHFNVKIALGYK